MEQLAIVVLDRDKRAVLRALGELGVMELRRTPTGPESAPVPPPDPAAGLARCEHLVSRVEELRSALGNAAPIEDRQPPREISLEQAQAHFEAIEKRADAVLKRRQRLLERWTELSTVCKTLSCYRGLDIPLDGTDSHSFLHFVAGSLPAENFQSLQQEVGANATMFPLPIREGRHPLLAMTTRQGKPSLETALDHAGFHREELPVIEGATVDSLSETSTREQASVTAELQKANEEVSRFAAKVAAALARIARAATTERHLLEAGRNFPRTQTAVLISGWVPTDDTEALEQRMSEVTGGRCVIETAAPEKTPPEQIPVLLRHPRLLRPFEMLVTAYGLPSYQELEPTLFVALSYLLMFGMMFGDAGHGAVLATGGLIALLAGRAINVRDMGVLLLFAGLSSMVFGIVYGSYFGLPQLKKYALWHDPLEGDPMALMYRAIEFGVVMMSLGLILNILNRFRRGDVLGGFLDKFGVAGLLFYWGTLTLLTQHAAFQSNGVTNLAAGVFLVLPMMGWALKEPLAYLRSPRGAKDSGEADGFANALLESLVGAFEAVLSYLANTISFVRLAAYAMSHAALLVAAFMVAEQVRQLSFGGDLLSVLVIIAGNLVAIVLEGIIASVQALRLEYYEFFGKFFSGTGQPFRPFHLTRYGQVSK
jgi:V/A-type H+-transporting ATPase subunit I